MEMVFDVAVLMMLVGFPVALVLVTLDEYSSYSSLQAFRHARPAARPRPVHGIYIRWHHESARLRAEVSGQDEPAARKRPLADHDRIGADAA